jgi:hypothetical protein
MGWGALSKSLPLGYGIVNKKLMSEAPISGN